MEQSPRSVIGRQLTQVLDVVFSSGMDFMAARKARREKAERERIKAMLDWRGDYPGYRARGVVRR